MAYITLAELKQHLKVEVSADDTYLTTLIGVAETAIGNELGKPLSWYEDDDGNIPTPLMQAIMIQAGDLYNNRESVAFAAPSEVPRTLEYLLNPYKKYDVGCSTDVEPEADPEPEPDPVTVDDPAPEEPPTVTEDEETEE